MHEARKVIADCHCQISIASLSGTFLACLEPPLGRLQDQYCSCILDAENVFQIWQKRRKVHYQTGVNQVNLLGRIGRDAETRGSATHPVVIFSLATNSVHTRSDGQTASRVEWHRVSVFKPGLREKVAANLKKGDRVFVTGAIRYDEYTDNQDNQVRTTTILANDIVNLTKRYLKEEREETVETGF